MAIHDGQVAVLRALVAGEWDDYRRRLNLLDGAEDGDGFVSLVTAAFFEAANRRFGKYGKPVRDARIVDFVASLRERSDSVADGLDPRVSETQIKLAIRALPPDGPRDWDGATGFSSQLVLLAGLMGDADYGETETAEFVERARLLAEEHLS